MLSIDLEERLKSALSKAENIEKQWAKAPIPENVQSSFEGAPQSPDKTKSPAAASDAHLPSIEAFSAMRDARGSVSGDQGHDHRYTVLHGLGLGGYSNVLLTRRKDTEEFLAMKVLSKELLTRSRDRARLKNELRALMEIPPSPFIQRCFAAFESPSHVCFVTEYLGGGDLFFHLTRRADAAAASGKASAAPCFAEEEARVLLAEITLGLEHMHGHRFIHCDIKVENIMLDAKGHVKLIDFGLSCELGDEEGPLSPIGSLIYMAPELLTQSVGGRHTDWWALGVLAHEMMTGRSPWSTLSDKKLIKKQIRKLQVEPPPSVSAAAGAFIVGLLAKDKAVRLGTRGSGTEVRAHAFFNSTDWPALERGDHRPAFTPPKAAFIREECENALEQYRGADLSPAEWDLGVEKVPSLPPVAAELHTGMLGDVAEDAAGSVGGGGGSGVALADALAMVSLDGPDEEPPGAPPPGPTPTPMPPSPPTLASSSSSSSSSRPASAAGSLKARASQASRRAAQSPPRMRGKSPASNGASTVDGLAPAKTSVGMRRGATPRAPKPRTPAAIKGVRSSGYGSRSTTPKAASKGRFN